MRDKKKRENENEKAHERGPRICINLTEWRFLDS
jgi:hypothetical protein